VIELLNRLLSQVLSQAPCPQSNRDRIKQMAQSVGERYIVFWLLLQIDSFTLISSLELTELTWFLPVLVPEGKSSHGPIQFGYRLWPPLPTKK